MERIYTEKVKILSKDLFWMQNDVPAEHHISSQRLFCVCVSAVVLIFTLHPGNKFVSPNCQIKTLHYNSSYMHASQKK